MAKSTSKSTKAKTKTTKKSAPAKAVKTTSTKAPKKTTKPAEKSAAKTTAASTTAKPDTKKEVRFAKVTRRTREVTASMLSRWHLVSAVVFTVLAVLAGVFMKSASYDVSVDHMTSDGLLSKTSTVFAPALHVMGSVDVRWLLVAMLVLSAVLSLVRFRSAAYERRALAVRVMPLRWLDYALTGAIAIDILALLAGVQSAVEIKTLAALYVAAMAFAWLAERENAKAQSFVKAAYIVSLLTGLVVLLAFLSFAFATPVYGMVRYPWYVYALYGVTLLGAVAVALLQSKTYRQVKQWTNYNVVERDHLVINLVVKVAFTVVLIAGLYHAL